MIMKNKLKIMFIFILFSVLVKIFLFPTITFAEGNYPQKGDLRCPNKKNTSTSYCKMYDEHDNEISEANSNVKKVIVTRTDKNSKVIVKKIVSKTDTPGRLNVQFKFEGDKTKKIQSNTKPYIVVIRDASTSLNSDDFIYSTEAAKSFAQLMTKDNKKYNLALIQFGDKLSNNSFSKFSTKNFDDVHFCYESDRVCNQGNDSNIHLAFDRASQLLSEAPEDATKYIIILGDGRYWYSADTNKKWKNIVNDELADLKNIPNLTFFGIYYKSNFDSRYVGWYNDHDSRIDILDYCDKSDNFPACDRKVMSSIIGDSCEDEAGNCRYISGKSEDKEDKYNKMFKYIAGLIDEKQVVDGKIFFEIIDTLGSEFRTNKKKTQITVKEKNIDNIFEININTSAKTGWHPTNNGFNFFYDSDSDDPYFSSNLDPEVYWEQESLDWNYCSDVSTTSSKKVDSGEYHKVTCEQGWGNTLGYRAELKVNGLSVKTSTFNIHNGMGFPITIDLTSNLRCTIQFDKDKFMNKYDNLNKKLNELTGNDENTQKEKASIEKQINNLIEYLNNFLNKYSNDSNQIGPLKEYKNIFEQQKALLKINYTSKNYNEVNFVNKGDVNSNIDCSNMDLTNILGKNIYLNRICVLSSNKTMQLPSICLSMKGGASEKCQDNSTSQLNGGNNYYIDLDESSGYVSVYLDNATFIGKTIKLEGNKKNDDNSYKCQFTTSLLSPIYRQIELTDPFVQTYTNKKRTIGKNWLNDSRKYNFVNIIDPEIWNKTFEYQYSMSKVDVEEIKKDTSQEGVSSYLGKDCSFNNKNEYICNFVRPSTGNNGKSNYFTNITVNK